eukprot:TRINITY_DN24408_c0_g1_i10.p2 TRINITY_DN24408_c0_g1~~TRINITY_DN24408_c0_g1_i10.p2  ORF type:complete len:112 (+),score=4.71 TRINITY_DN24408_c0_g1_i10:508-843(+)
MEDSCKCQYTSCYNIHIVHELKIKLEIQHVDISINHAKQTKSSFKTKLLCFADIVVPVDNFNKLNQSHLNTQTPLQKSKNGQFWKSFLPLKPPLAAEIHIIYIFHMRIVMV